MIISAVFTYFQLSFLYVLKHFVSLKYIQKPEISYEFDVRLIFTPMYGGFTDCTIHASAAALIHRQQTLYWLFTQTKLNTEINLLSFIHVLGLGET